jgi:hypothetical protein
MKTSRTSRERTFRRTGLKNGSWRVRSLKAWYLVVVFDFLTAPMPWLFSKTNSFAHEDPANALMSASVKGKSPTHHHSSNRFHPSPSGFPLTSVAAQLPTNSKEFFVLSSMPQTADGDLHPPHCHSISTLSKCPP